MFNIRVCEHLTGFSKRNILFYFLVFVHIDVRDETLSQTFCLIIGYPHIDLPRCNFWEKSTRCHQFNTWARPRSGMWWSSPGAYWKTFKTFKNSNFTSWTTNRIHSQCCWFCNKQINIIFKRLFSSFRMYRGFHRIINRRFHPDLLEKSIKSKFLPMTVQQPPIRKSRNVNSWWPELVYKLGLLSWTNSQALFNR